MITAFLNNGYSPGNIFVLAATVKSPKTPVRKLENIIKTSTNIPVFVPKSENEQIDEEMTKNKIIFSTFD